MKAYIMTDASGRTTANVPADAQIARDEVTGLYYRAIPAKACPNCGRPVMAATCGPEHRAAQRRAIYLNLTRQVGA